MQRITIRGIATVVTAIILLSAGSPLSAQTISGIGTSNSSAPLNQLESNGSIIPALAIFDTLSSVSVTSSAASTFTTRYISTNTVDSDAFHPDRLQTLQSSYQISFTVTAPGLYELTVDTSLVGDLCLDDDNVLPPAGNWAEIYDVSGGQSGGTLASGSLGIAFPGGKQSIGDTDLSFDPITSPFNRTAAATITGSSFGVPQIHTLSFAWTQRSYTPGFGDPSTVRLGQASRLNDINSCTYTVPPRPQAPDGHWVTVTVSGVAGCGDGDVDVGEDCDGGGSNGDPGSCCTDDCEFVTAGTVCRSTSLGDDCDVEETCTGASGACPPNGVAPPSTVCRTAAGVCDQPENCDGSGAQCPPDAKSSAQCRAAAGVCDVAESCDGVGDHCPSNGFAAPSVTCRTSAGECDVAETCPGNGPACPPDTTIPNGTPCTDDGAFCNGDETCQGGTCVGDGNPCAPQACDELADMCLAGGCASLPASGCLTSDKSILLFKDKASDASDKLIYKWIRGQSTTQLALSDPTDSAGYALCLYAGTAAALIFEAHVDPSATRWSELGDKGYRYKESNGSEDGTQRVILKASDSDKSKALWKARGGSLPDLAPATLPISDFPVTVQLRNDQGSVCIESTFDDGDVRRNTSGQLTLKDQ